MAFYDDMAALATEMLAPEADGGFGKTTAYIRAITSTYNSTTGAVTEVPTDTAINAVQISYNERHSPNAQIEEGDIFWMLDGLANIADELLINDYLYDVVQTWPIMPGDTFIACRAQTRKGIAV